MDLFFKCLMAAIALVSLATTIHNLLTNHKRNQERDEANRRAAQAEATAALAIRTEQRVSGLEARVGSFEQRVERGIESMTKSIGEVKDMFTKYLIDKN